MRSSSGTSAVREHLVVLAAACASLVSGAAHAIDFDAIFYRARAGFDFCYEFTGTAGWSLRAIDGGRITHDYRDPCPTSGLDPSQLAASGDCPGGTCHADCASFVRRAWAAGADTTLRTLAAPEGGNCADPSDYGAERFVTADASVATITDALADARPGDWCSHADHVLMLVRQPTPNASRWIVWEANSAAVGIGQGGIALDASWLRRIVRDDCKWTEGPGANGTWQRPERAWKNSGCWHPPAQRTGPPEALALASGSSEVAQDGVVYVDALERLVLRFERPADMPALADYVLWVRWPTGGAGDDATFEHHLVRIPAFSRRDDAPRRLARFPEVPPGVRDFPLDVDEASVIEIDYADLATAPSALVTSFRNPTTGVTTERWSPGQGLTPVVPDEFQQDGLALAPGRSYAWRVRVERYGELATDGRRRAATIPACEPDADGVEQVEYCRDPMWSEEHRFTLVCAAEDDSCPRSGPVAGEECTAAPARPEASWTSGCAPMQLAATEVNADGFVDVAITTSSGLCAGAGVWAAPSDYALFQGQEVREAETHFAIYDFCTDGPAQPTPSSYGGVVVKLPDDWSGTVRFHIPGDAGSEGCIDYIGPASGGTCRMYDGTIVPAGEFEGPMVVAGGYGGTHGWSTVRMFSIAPPRIAADPGTP